MINRRIADVDYEVKINDKLKLYHINMLKSFLTPEIEAVIHQNTVDETRYDTHIGSSLITEKIRMIYKQVKIL